MHPYTHTCAHIYIRMHMHTYAQIENLSNNTSTCQITSCVQNTCSKVHATLHYTVHTLKH